MKQLSGNSTVTVLNSSLAVDFTLLTTEHTRVRSANKDYPINLPLIKMKPPKGYGINIIIKGHNHVANANTARQVVVEVIRLYAENDIEISENNAWFNANLYWLKQLSVRHGYTTVENLMMLVDNTK